MKLSFFAIEPLEARIAPASLNLAGTILTYTDIDGDFVKVTFTHATMAPVDFTFSTGSVTVGGDTTTPQSLTSIDLTGKTGAGFTLVAKPQTLGGVLQGDSHANVKTINGAGTNLGTIAVDGNVEDLSAGEPAGAPGTGLKTFSALSMGKQTLGTKTFELFNVGSFKVKTDVVDEKITFTGGVKTVSIGGDLAETTAGTQASIIVDGGSVGSVTIGGSVIGYSSGQPNIHLIANTVGTLSIGGSIIGGSASLSSSVQVQVNGSMKTFRLGGDLQGGRGDRGGALQVQDVGTLTIGGSLIGTDNVSVSGLVSVAGDAGSITIGGSIRGGDSTSGAHLANGEVDVLGDVGTFKLGHDLVGGHAAGGTLTDSSIITVRGTVGALTIGGSVTGDDTHAAAIAVGGGLVKATLAAIKTLTIKGNVTQASILAGYYFNAGQNSDSGIGSIAIGGNLAASFIGAGNSRGTDNIAGNNDDGIVAGSVATIGSVKIGGAFTGIPGDVIRYHIQAPILNKLTIAKASYTHAQLVDTVRFESIGFAKAVSFR